MIKGLLGENTDSRSGAENVQDGSGMSCCTGSKAALRDDGFVLKGLESQLEEAFTGMVQWNGSI